MVSQFRPMNASECVDECGRLGIVLRVAVDGRLWLAGEFFTLMTHSALLSQLQTNQNQIRRTLQCQSCERDPENICFECWMRQPAVRTGPGRIVWQPV